MVKIAIVQAGSTVYDTAGCIEKRRSLGGYPKGLDFGVRLGTRSEEGRHEFERYFNGAITYDGPEAAQLAEIAAESKVFYYGPNGERIGKHRKLMPTALGALRTSIGKIGAAICWENLMPLLRTHMYQNGVQIYLAPTVDDRDTWLSTMRAIAFLTNKDFPAGHPTHESEKRVLIRGGSCAVSPFGQVLVAPVFDSEALHVVDVDLAECTRGKFDLDVAGHYARPDVFQLTVNTKRLTED
ncbi:Nitrilase [Aphelenchoides fujianensis]|nr:Nitrilase [Aphelenchoides fujianensis]